MAMQAIARIPLDAETPNIATLVENREFDAEIGDKLRELADHAAGNQMHLSNCMDWAMQIRDNLGITWGECIDAAMTLYFG